MNNSVLYPNLKAVFFDLDDVLVFSENSHCKAWQLSLHELGINPDLIDFHSLIGISDFQQAKNFAAQFNLKESAETLLELKRNTFLDITKNGFESAAGRNTLLEKLSSLYKVGIVSSSPRKVIQEVIQLEKIAPYFQFIIGFDDCLKHKPDPLPYQQALSLAGVAPHEALVIEDSVSGITAALRADIPVMGLLKNQQPHQIVANINYFNSFTEIQEELFHE